MTVPNWFDGDQVIAEYEDGTLVRKFIYGPGIDEPICMIDVQDNNEVYYYHFDGLGSVIALSNTNNEIVEQYSYDVFGEPNTTSMINNPYFFTGRRLDSETSLFYYRARYYDYVNGRFIGPDPIGYDEGVNIYSYCWNSPINFVDVSGTRVVKKGDRKSLKQAKKYLWKSKEFQKIYRKLDKSSNVYTFVARDNITRPSYDWQNRTVYWNPTLGAEFKDKDDPSISVGHSPAMLLAHEICEGWFYETTKHIDQRKDPIYDTVRDREIITGPEAIIANDVGEYTRGSHQINRYYEADSVIDNIPELGKKPQKKKGLFNFFR